MSLDIITDKDTIKDYNKLLEILQKEINKIYNELENKGNNCSTNIKKQNISKIINSRKKYDSDKLILLNLQNKLDTLNK